MPCALLSSRNRRPCSWHIASRWAWGGSWCRFASTLRGLLAWPWEFSVIGDDWRDCRGPMDGQCLRPTQSASTKIRQSTIGTAQTLATRSVISLWVFYPRSIAPLWLISTPIAPVPSGGHYRPSHLLSPSCYLGLFQYISSLMDP